MSCTVTEVIRSVGSKSREKTCARGAFIIGALLLVTLWLSSCNGIVGVGVISPVTNFVASAGNTRIALTWERITGATRYLVYRQNTDSTIDLVATVTTNSYTDTGLTNGTNYRYVVQVVNNNGESGQSDTVSATPTNFDTDEDLLIEISSLEQLDNIRYNLAGTSYKVSASGVGARCGATGEIDCVGYELTSSLDFADPDSYSRGVVNEDWRPTGGDPDSAANPGWDSIGNSAASFATVFEGNGHTISNLYTRGGDRRVGLFGSTTIGAVIRNLGVLAGRAYGGGGDGDYVGVLVGRQYSGRIIASYATGNADGGEGARDSVGILVGQQYSGSIVASYATGNADGGGGDGDSVGGLVGDQRGGTITASYAAGDADGGGGTPDFVGGLVGRQFGSITASYATVNVDGGEGLADSVGGLAGSQGGGVSTVSSYGFGITMNGDAVVTPRPAGVINAMQLDSMNAGSEWNDAALRTMDAWDFLDATQPPVLRYADYDGDGSEYACALVTPSPPAGTTLIAKCGEVLSNQVRE